MELERLFVDVYKDVPTSLYICLLIIFLVSLLVVLPIKRFNEGWRLLGKVLLIEYTILLLGGTIIFRQELDFHKYNFQPFWSYMAILHGDKKLMAENLLNVVAFIPYGSLLCLSFHNMKWGTVLLYALSLPFSIEVLQYVLNRGFSEFDDVFHNAVGCMIGFGLFKIIKVLYERITKRNMEILFISLLASMEVVWKGKP